MIRLRNYLKNAALASGLFVGRPPRREAVAGVLGLLRPVVASDALIRMGGPNDGGYLVPDLLTSIEACFSPGVANSADFEMALASRGIPAHLADASVDGVPLELEPFEHTFDSVFIGACDGPGVSRLASWFCRHYSLPTDLDFILQMDIEGAEYETLLDTPPELLSRFRIAVVEYHFLDRLLDSFGIRVIEATLRKMADLFLVAHVHPNNTGPLLWYEGLSIPPLLEVTYLRRGETVQQGDRTFPHPLDSPCDPTRPEIVLDPQRLGWYDEA